MSDGLMHMMNTSRYDHVFSTEIEIRFDHLISTAYLTLLSLVALSRMQRPGLPETCKSGQKIRACGKEVFERSRVLRTQGE